MEFNFLGSLTPKFPKQKVNFRDLVGKIVRLMKKISDYRKPMKVFSLSENRFLLSVMTHHSSKSHDMTQKFPL